MTEPRYTTQLQAGLGMVQETRALLDLWADGMTSKQLEHVALQSGRFPNISLRRLENVVIECFAPRYLRGKDEPARALKHLQSTLSTSEFEQLLFLYTCRANAILADFVGQIYWPAYSVGKKTITNQDASLFVRRANSDGKMVKYWSDSTVRRVSGYLTGCCADFGLLEAGPLKTRRILPFRMEPRAFVYLAYDLHWSGLGDVAVLEHRDWELFGLGFEDVLAEMKRLALKGPWLVQSAGHLLRISWLLESTEGLGDAFATGRL